jgi:hypothetical protein
LLVQGAAASDRISAAATPLFHSRWEGVLESAAQGIVWHRARRERLTRRQALKLLEKHAADSAAQSSHPPSAQPVAQIEAATGKVFWFAPIASAAFPRRLGRELRSAASASTRSASQTRSLWAWAPSASTPSGSTRCLRAVEAAWPLMLHQDFTAPLPGPALCTGCTATSP